MAQIPFYILHRPRICIKFVKFLNYIKYVLNSIERYLLNKIVYSLKGKIGLNPFKDSLGAWGKREIIGQIVQSSSYKMNKFWGI